MEETDMADTVATRGAYPEQFYPGTEELAADEMRITALGTVRSCAAHKPTQVG